MDWLTATTCVLIKTILTSNESDGNGGVFGGTRSALPNSAPPQINTRPAAARKGNESNNGTTL